MAENRPPAALLVPQHDVRVVGGELVVLQVQLTGVSRVADVSVCIEPPDMVEVCVPERYYLKLRLPVPIAPTADEVRFKAKTGRLTMTCSTLSSSSSSSDSSSRSSSDHTDQDDEQTQLQAEPAAPDPDAHAAAQPQQQEFCKAEAALPAEADWQPAKQQGQQQEPAEDAAAMAAAAAAAEARRQWQQQQQQQLKQQQQREAAAAAQRAAKEQQLKPQEAAAAAGQAGQEQQRGARRRDRHHNAALAAHVGAKAGPGSSSSSSSKSSAAPHGQASKAEAHGPSAAAVLGRQTPSTAAAADADAEGVNVATMVRAARMFYTRPHARNLVGCWCRLVDVLSLWIVCTAAQVWYWLGELPDERVPFGLLADLTLMPMRMAAILVVCLPNITLKLWRTAWRLPLNPTLMPSGRPGWLGHAEAALATGEHLWKAAVKLCLAAVSAAVAVLLWWLLQGPWLLAGLLACVWYAAAPVVWLWSKLVWQTTGADQAVAKVMVAAVSTVSCFCTTSLPVSSCNISLAMLQVLITGGGRAALGVFLLALLFHNRQVILAGLRLRRYAGTAPPAAEKQHWQLVVHARWWSSVFMVCAPVLLQAWRTHLGLWGADDTVASFANNAASHAAVAGGTTPSLGLQAVAAGPLSWLATALAWLWQLPVYLLAAAAVFGVPVLHSVVGIAALCGLVVAGKVPPDLVDVAVWHSVHVLLQAFTPATSWTYQLASSVHVFLRVITMTTPSLDEHTKRMCSQAALHAAHSPWWGLQWWLGSNEQDCVDAADAVRHRALLFSTGQQGGRPWWLDLLLLAWFGVVVWHVRRCMASNVYNGISGDAVLGHAPPKAVGNRQQRRQEAARQLREAKAAARRDKARQQQQQQQQPRR